MSRHKKNTTVICLSLNLDAGLNSLSHPLLSLPVFSLHPAAPTPLFLKWHEGCDGWSPRSSRLRPHRWGEIKVLCELLTVLPFLHTSGGDMGEEGERHGEGWRGSHLQPWHHRLITYHVSPAAPRQAQRDRSHLSSLRGSQYNLLCWSDIQRRAVELPNLILQMKTLLFLPSHVLVCHRRWGRGLGISDWAVIWKQHPVVSFLVYIKSACTSQLPAFVANDFPCWKTLKVPHSLQRGEKQRI